MGVSAYLNFAGNCREAVEFYAKVFGSPAPRIMSYGDAPPDPAFPLDEATKKLVMHAEVEVAGTTLMFSDLPAGRKVVVGDNVNLIVQSASSDDITRWFDALKAGGKIVMELGPQFWTGLYGFVYDKFGIGWQLGLPERSRGAG